MSQPKPTPRPPGVAPIIGSLVTILAAIAASQGIQTTTEEQQGIVNSLAGIVGGIAFLVGFIHAKAMVDSRKPPRSPYPPLKPKRSKRRLGRREPRSSGSRDGRHSN